MNGPLGLTAGAIMQNLQEFKERGQMESDLARTAEAAAGMFEGLGFPEAQAFAEQLRADPVGAGMMARGFGGFQNLYTALQAQQRARQASEATRELSGTLEGAGGTGGSPQGSPVLRMRLSTMGYDPNKILGPAAGREGPDVLDRAMKLGGMRFRELGPALNSRLGLERVGSQLAMAERTNNPVAAFAAIRQYIASLDNSVVRGEEFRSFMDSIGVAQGLANQWAQATGDLARSELARQTADAAAQAVTELDKAIARRDVRFRKLADVGQIPWEYVGGMETPSSAQPQGGQIPTLPPRPGQGMGQPAGIPQGFQLRGVEGE